MTLSDCEATREFEKALGGRASDLSNTKDSCKAISNDNLVSLANILDCFTNLTSSDKDGRSLSKAATATTSITIAVVISVGCNRRRSIVAAAAIPLLGNRHGNELEGFTSLVLKLSEERSAVDLKTLVHKVGLLHDLVRSGDSTKVVLAPSVESLGTVDGLEHSSVDIGVQSDHTCVVRRGVGHSLELLGEFA